MVDALIITTGGVSLLKVPFPPPPVWKCTQKRPLKYSSPVLSPLSFPRFVYADISCVRITPTMSAVAVYEESGLGACKECPPHPQPTPPNHPPTRPPQEGTGGKGTR